MCPKCDKGPLERLISGFAFLKGAEEDEMGMPDLDEAKLGKAMSLLEQEAENLNEDDPGQAAHLTRKLCDITGLNLGSRMEEALRRMEAGEDPEKIEEEMGDVLKEENLFNKSSEASKKAKKSRLHEMKPFIIYNSYNRL
jgi:DNA-directed RNA polymerase alpha subunit